MRRTTSTLLPALALSALVFTGCAVQRDDTPRPDLAPLRPVATLPRLAPDFSFGGATVRSLRGLKGQAVVLVMADSPKTRAFRQQMRKLEGSYSEFASRQTVFIAAFRNGEGPAGTNVPFALAKNGAAVAQTYGLGNEDFSIAIIGKDGNLDYQTYKVLPGERVRDVIQNSYAVQIGNRKSP
jgi:hypothetical protein